VPKSPYKNPPSFDAVSEAFCYDPTTGYFTRRYDRGHFRKGTRIGSLNSLGYEKIYFEGRLHGSSRLAWLYMTGEWPEFEIDHKNRRPGDNRWENLRAATTAENGANRVKEYRAIYRGVKILNGVSFSASICVRETNIHLGTYNSAEKAALAYDQAAKKHHGEFAVFNFPGSVHRDWILV
jgi:HNH endonuclease